MYARERVRRAAWLDVRLKHRNLGAVLLRECAASQPTHARPDDDDIILFVQIVATQPVTRTLVHWLVVARVD